MYALICRASAQIGRRAHPAAAHANDPRLFCAVLRHVLANAPPRGEYYTPTNAPIARKSTGARGRAARAARGVCRLRVSPHAAAGAAAHGDVAAAETPQTGAAETVEALALSRRELRRVVFRGQSLGAAGAMVARNQANALGLVYAPQSPPSSPTTTAATSRTAYMGAAAASKEGAAAWGQAAARRNTARGAAVGAPQAAAPFALVLRADDLCRALTASPALAGFLVLGDAADLPALSSVPGAVV